MSSGRIELSLPAQLDRMERARVVRDATPRLRDEHVTLSHGSGGKSSRALIESIILPAFNNALLDGSADSAILRMPNDSERIAFTTDSYVVNAIRSLSFGMRRRAAAGVVGGAHSGRRARHGHLASGNCIDRGCGSVGRRPNRDG